MWKTKFTALRRLLRTPFLIERLYDSIIEQSQREKLYIAKNPLNKYGMKSFSQAEEDGITIEICRRIGVERGSYCEYGVGDGLECNTLALAALGWKGFWISGQPLSFRLSGINPSVFRFYQERVTSSNVVSLYRTACEEMNFNGVDIISFDLDGNDFYFVKSLLENGARPKLFIVEYNARFIPPARWRISIDDDFVWNQTDYFGASLQSFIDIFEDSGYLLVCCNSHTGNNAFFVDKIYAEKFSDVPKNIIDIYQPLNYNIPVMSGHKKDPRTVYEIFRRVS